MSACRLLSMPVALICIVLSQPLAAGSVEHGCPPAALAADSAKPADSIDDTQRQALAVALLACLGHPDPALRDELAYATLAAWMRDGKLRPETLRTLRRSLLADLRAQDDAGFRAPFAALVLSEVVRVDRISPWLDDAERRATLDAAAAYVRDVRDYRGFIDGEGWRHGVAHGADVLMQLALNPALDATAAKPVLDAVAAQVAPSVTAYHFGEEGRLARVVVAVASRGWLDAEGWQTWFHNVADPAPLSSWNEAFGSEADLNRLHNLRAFLLAVHVRVADSNGDAATALKHGLRPAIDAIP